MNLVYNLLFIILLVLIGFFVVSRVRIKLLKLWKEVSVKEVIFHKLLLETTKLIYNERLELKNEENANLFRLISRYKKKKVRYLLLKERQDLFTALNYLINDIEELEDEKYKSLLQKFKELQKARRIYNSKVLVYNQAISVFPTRFLALKMNLKLKEYFG
jgi:hypothetical protein